MKAKIIYLSLTLVLLAACTPTPNTTENSEYKAPSIYGTGGEHSAEPDNEKDWNP